MDLLDRFGREVRRLIGTTSIQGGLRMPPAVEMVFVKLNDKIRLRPFTKNNILYYYLPLQSLVSYSALSINVMHPSLITSVFAQRNITNVLLLSAASGAGFWVWSRPHMSAAAPARRFSWAFLCSSMWSLGSILLWAVIRTSVNKRPFVAVLLGLTSGAVLTYTGIDYLNYVDSMLTGGLINEDLSDVTAQSDDEKYDDL